MSSVTERALRFQNVELSVRCRSFSIFVRVSDTCKVSQGRYLRPFNDGVSVVHTPAILFSPSESPPM
jgi:hypothetical protein